MCLRCRGQHQRTCLRSGGRAIARVLDLSGKFVREIGKNLYACSFAHAVRVDRYDNIWVADKGSAVVVRFDPQGRVTRVFGRKAEAWDESAHPLEHPLLPLPPVDGLFRAGHGYDVGLSRQRIHQRWLYQFSSGQIRQGRQLGWIFGASLAPDPVNSIICIRLRSMRKIGCMLRIAATCASRFSIPRASCSTRSRSIDPRRRIVPLPSATGRPKRVLATCIQAHRGHFASRPVRCSTFTCQDAYPRRIYKLTLDGKILGWLGGTAQTLEEIRLDP